MQVKGKKTLLFWESSGKRANTVFCCGLFHSSASSGVRRNANSIRAVHWLEGISRNVIVLI